MAHGLPAGVVFCVMKTNSSGLAIKQTNSIEKGEG
jgi:hypothetical protein